MPDRCGSPGLTLAVLGVAAMAFSVLQSLVIPVLPAIGRDLQVSQQAVTWVLTGYLLSASVATPILGRLGDMYGKRRLLVITLAALAAGTVVSGLAAGACRADRGPGRPGPGRRAVPAGVRDYPRRVPGRTGCRGDRVHLRHARHRRRAGHHPGRPGRGYSRRPNVIVESVPAGQTGVATGMNANIRTLGSALGGQVTTSIVTTTIVTASIVRPAGGGPAYPADRGFTISFIVLAVISLGAAAVAARVPDNRRRRASIAEPAPGASS